MSLFGAAIQTEKGSIHTHKQTRQIYIYRLISRRGSLRQNRLPGRTDKAAESYIQRRKEDDVRYGSKLENLDKNTQNFGKILEKGHSESLLNGKQEWNIFPSFDNLKVNF